MEHVTPVAVVPAGSDAPQETFCVVDLAMPDSTPGPCVLRCIWRADHFDVELVHEGRVWSKQGARKPDVQAFSDSEWLRYAKEAFAEGLHHLTAERYDTTHGIKLRWTLASPRSGSFATYPLVPHQSSDAAAFNITVAAARAARAATAARVIATAQADAARAEAAGAQKLAAQAVAAKEDSEKDLFARFAHVMNAQKQRFRILVEELEQAKTRIGLEEEERARTSDEEAPDELTRPGGTQPTQSQRLRDQGGAKELVLQRDGGGASMPAPDIYSSQRHFSQQQPAGEAAASPSKRAAGSAWGTQAAGGDGDDDLTTSAVARKPRVAAKKKAPAKPVNFNDMLQLASQAPQATMDED